MSLPGILGTTVADLPATMPYLSARPELVERWRQELGQTPGYRVGIVWQGNTQHPEDHLRSVSLRQFAALAGLPGVQLFSLQKGPGQEQVRSARAWPLIDLGVRLDQSGPFLDTAAVLKGLDLVVTVDSAVAHLAGALAVPVWVVLHLAPDWRWLEGRDDSPWYPTMRLFRQRRYGDWDDVFDRVAAALHQRSAGRPQPLRIEVSAGELFDRLTILALKRDRLTDDARTRVQQQLAELSAVRSANLPDTPALLETTAELAAVNAALWELEDEVRLCERQQDFGPRFVVAARAIAVTNDRRSRIKRRLDDLAGSPFSEEKVYAPTGKEEQSS
jgi:hypothetical protein